MSTAYTPTHTWKHRCILVNIGVNIECGFASAHTYLWSIAVSCAAHDEMCDRVGNREWCKRKYRMANSKCQTAFTIENVNAITFTSTARQESLEQIINVHTHAFTLAYKYIYVCIHFVFGCLCFTSWRSSLFASCLCRLSNWYLVFWFCFRICCRYVLTKSCAQTLAQINKHTYIFTSLCHFRQAIIYTIPFIWSEHSYMVRGVFPERLDFPLSSCVLRLRLQCGTVAVSSFSFMWVWGKHILLVLFVRLFWEKMETRIDHLRQLRISLRSS